MVDNLHPNGRESRKRQHTYEGNGKAVIRERSSSRPRDGMERRDQKPLQILRRKAKKEKEERGRAKNWVQKAIRQRKRGALCHICRKRGELEEDLSCPKCGHKNRILYVAKQSDTDDAGVRARENHPNSASVADTSSIDLRTLTLLFSLEVVIQQTADW